MTTSAAAPARTPLKLFVTLPPAEAAQRWLDRLARFLDLDVFGESLLSRRARADMRIQAVLLVIVFVFDLGVWTLMANLLFGAGAFAAGWHTLPAVLFGLATASVVFAWERSFAIFDTRRGAKGQVWRWSGFVARVGLIGLAAWATAKPFELMVFRKPISERLDDEAVRQQAVLNYLRIKNLEREVNEVQKRRANLAAEAQQVLEGADASIAKAIAALELELRSVNRQIQHLSEDIATAEAEERTPQATVWRGRLQALEGRRQTLMKQIADYQAKPGETLIAERRRIAAQLDQEIAAKREAIRATDEGFARMRSQKRATQRAQVGAAGQTAPPEAGIFQQLRIVHDLVEGVAPQWPDGNATVIQEAKKRYAIEDYAAAETHAYQVMSWIALTVGVAIPLMVLLFKFVMSSEDLAQYYSLSAQVAAGNPEAMQQVDVRRRADTVG